VTTAADELLLRLATTRGLLREEQIAAARAEIAGNTGSNTAGGGLWETLVRQGSWDVRQNAGLFAAEFGLQTVELDTLEFPAEVLALVPRELAVRLQLIPFARLGQTLRVAVSDPLDTDSVDGLAHRLGLTIETWFAPADSILKAIQSGYGQSADLLDTLLEDLSRTDEVHGAIEAPLASDAAADAPIIKLVHSLIVEAVQRRASDIHLEPLERRLRVRYRIDGVLIEAESPPKRLQLAIVSRLKIMANISIAQKRLPGDGRIQMVVGERTLDLRVSSLPTVHGESIVMRILDKKSLQLGLPELGFLPDDQASFEQLITLPDGIVLVTGPTGSGKTTTLYGCLHHINKPDRKIITVEDPVEYQLTGINQVPVRHEVGMTFASALRAMLRQAPNIVMIGEIRDLETAEIAINASLTGHMVFSTLHTNDAPGAVTRLIDIGVKPFLVSTALRATMAQRLVRKICQKCQRSCAPDAEKLRSLNLDPATVAAATFKEGAGCDACSGSGFRGRMGIFEVFVVNEEIQRMIYENTRSTQLRAKARSLGMRTMREDGLRKATAGLTTVEEVVSITIGEES
jgi:general secretion pathway protein E/type IV pilus assembly protein PilB